MVERHAVMLRELRTAIAFAERNSSRFEDARTRVLSALRAQHHLCVRSHMYLEAWCIHGVIQMIDDSPTVNDILRELKALTGETPHSNRGVTLTPKHTSVFGGIDE